MEESCGDGTIKYLACGSGYLKRCMWSNGIELYSLTSPTQAQISTHITGEIWINAMDWTKDDNADLEVKY